jgi:hypothetical protein
MGTIYKVLVVSSHPVQAERLAQQRTMISQA